MIDGHGRPRGVAPEGLASHDVEALDETLFGQRPVQAVKVNYLGVWLVTLGMLCTAVALWGLLRPWVNRLLWPGMTERGERVSEEFVTIAYEGISKNGRDVSPERFKEHLASLRDAGYVPVGLKDVEALLFEGRPLPKSAVLVTMDQSRKSTHFQATQLLRRAGWNAVMFLWTRPILDKDPAALLWPYLRSMARSGVWEFGAQGHDGYQRVVTSPGGRTGGFMTSPLWLADEKRYEEPSEFFQRLQGDHDRCLADIRDHLGVTPLAYAYPYGDFGQFQRRTGVARPINLRLAAERYRLAFTLGNLALNTRHSDPRRLNRLLVRANWSGADLVERLNRSWTRSNPELMRGGVPVPEAWISDWGTLQPEVSGALALNSSPQATGAKAWLAGSDLMQNLSGRFRFRLDAGQFAVYLRASADGESYVCLSLGEAQSGLSARLEDDASEASSLPESAHAAGVWLSQKRAGQPRVTLASSILTASPGIEHELTVNVRDRFLSATLDGREVFAERSPLRWTPEPGLVGLSVWSPRKGEARAVLTDAEVRIMRPALAVWTPKADQEGHLCRWVENHASRLTALSPRWVDFGVPKTRLSSGMDMAFFRTLARVNRLDLHPKVVVSDQADLRWLTPTFLAEKVNQEGLDGILVDLSGCDQKTEPVLASWLHAGTLALAKKGARLTVQLPEWYGSHSRIPSLLAVMPGAKVALTREPDESAVSPGLTERLVRVEEVPPPPEDEPLPAAYMIPSEWGGAAASETVEDKGERLEQEGLVAFRDGQYDRAIEMWKGWLRLEPANPRAHTLIGDALSRKGDLPGAVAAYGRSLDLDPGQTSVAIRQAEFYRAMGQPEQARDILNLYARLFPGDDPVLRAQAWWLSQNGRESEALEIVRSLLERNPEDVDALVLCLRLASTPDERKALLDRLVTAGSLPQNHLALGQAVWANALTALPGSDSLHALVERIASEDQNARVAELFARIRTLSEPVADNLGKGGYSENRWWADGAFLAPSPKGLGRVLKTLDTNTEGVLRLLGSLRLRNAFAEALVGRVEGSFWLFVGRTQDQYARFGLAGDGYLRIQVWRNKRMVDERKLPFERTSEPLRLRLELKGDGVAGYVLGMPSLDGLLTLPLAEDQRYGWSGFAVYDAERGRASAELLEIGAGPLPVRLGWVAPVQDEGVRATQLESLRKNAPLLTAICPAGQALDRDGVWSQGQGVDGDFLRTLARYYRIWYAPAVQCASPEAVKPAVLLARAAECKADGFILFLPSWPSDPWWSALREGLATSDLRVLVVVDDPASSSARVAALGRGMDFLASANALVRPMRRVRAGTPVDLGNTEFLMIEH